jgi:hypothetical protein
MPTVTEVGTLVYLATVLLGLGTPTVTELGGAAVLIAGPAIGLTPRRRPRVSMVAWERRREVSR